MNLKEIALKNNILEIKVGSHLYGTNTPTSDIDLSGIFIAPKEFYLGLKTVNEVDMSIISKKENGRNDKDAIDRKFYELRKFMKLATDNNPNIIEHLFVKNNNIVFANRLGQKLLANRFIFPYKGCYNKFCGYAYSQRKKMIVKKENMSDILKAIQFFGGQSDPSRNYVVQYKKQLLNEVGFKNIKDTGQHFLIGDTSVQKNETLKKALMKFQERRQKFSGRYDDYVSKSGYDTKFASHLIRLMYEGIELLETGEIQFPLKEVQLISDIKNGKYDILEVLDIADELNSVIDKALKKSDLPNGPQLDKIENLLIEMVEESWEFENES